MPDRGKRKLNARASDAHHEALERCAQAHGEDKSTLILGGLEMLLEDRGYWPPDGGEGEE